MTRGVVIQQPRDIELLKLEEESGEYE